jgi:hypothetical protein
MDDIEDAFDAEFEGEIPDTVDEAALVRMRTASYLLDECFRVPGTEFRFGLEPVLSVVPVVGDAVGAGFSLYIVAESAYLGVGPLTQDHIKRTHDDGFTCSGLPGQDIKPLFEIDFQFVDQCKIFNV